MQRDQARRGAQRASVHLLEQVGDVRGDQVDHALRGGFVGRQADRFAHGALGPVGVAPAQLGQATDVGRRIVHLLAGEGVFVAGRRGCAGRLGGVTRGGRGVGRRRPGGRMAADADRHRRGGTQVGRRRHCGDVAGVEDVGAGTGRPRTARRHIARHGHRRGEDGLDDLPHRSVQPARRVHLQHHELHAFLAGQFQAVHHVGRAGGPDGAGQRQHHHRGGRRKDKAAPGGGHACRQPAGPLPYPQRRSHARLRSLLPLPRLPALLVRPAAGPSHSV